MFVDRANFDHGFSAAFEEGFDLTADCACGVLLGAKGRRNQAGDSKDECNPNDAAHFA